MAIEIRSKGEMVVDWLSQLEDRIVHLETENFQLRALGWVGQDQGLGVPAEWLKDGKYVYFVFPMQDGERVRKYIKAKDLRAAREGVERQKRVIDNEKYLSSLRAMKFDCETTLSRLEWRLKEILVG